MTNAIRTKQQAKVSSFDLSVIHVLTHREKSVWLKSGMVSFQGGAVIFLFRVRQQTYQHLKQTKTINHTFFCILYP